ncbi:MAG TPA: hypothetical protein VMM13_11690 [Euzebya sp.]|nr:hypothetical protein [Euzebya sp.]
MSSTDLRTPTGQLPSWAEACQMLRDPAQFNHLGRAQLTVLRAMGIADVALNGEPYVLPALLDGVTLRHRLTAAEVAGDHLELDPDLSILSVPAQRGLVATSGQPLRLGSHLHLSPPTVRRVMQSGRRLLLGPPGWLRPFRAGDLVGVHLIDATLLVLACSTGGDAAALATRLRVTAAPIHDRVVENGAPAALPLEGLVLGEMALDDALYRDVAVAPLTEVLQAADLPHALGYIGRPGRPDVPLPAHARGNPGNDMLPSQLPDERMAELLELGRIVGRFGLGAVDPLDGHSREGVLAPLRDWETVELLADTAGAEPGLRTLVDTLLPGAPRALRAPLHHLRAVHHLRTGALAHALSDLDAAMRTASDAEVVVALAVELRAIIGDGTGAQALLQLLADDHPLHEVCTALLPLDTAPLEGAHALLLRVIAYVMVAGCGDLLEHQRHAFGHRGLHEGHLPAEMVIDDLLHHRAGLARAALEMGPLLCDAELASLRRWQEEQRGWWKVVGCVADRARLRALVGGTEVEAYWPWPGTFLDDEFDATGDLVLARLLPIGDDWWMAPGALTVEEDVSLHDLPDPSDIVAVRLWAARPDSTGPRSSRRDGG